MLYGVGMVLLGLLGLVVLLIVLIIIASSISAYLNAPPRPLPDDKVIEMLRTHDLGEIPEPLRGPAPRRDVFSFRGYLKQKRYRKQYLPMLMEGPIYRGLCICWHELPGAGECDATYEYAWLDRDGRLHRKRETSYYDHHAVLSQGSGDVHPVLDANFKLDSPVTIVCSNTTDDHIVYEALLIEKDPIPSPEGQGMYR